MVVLRVGVACHVIDRVAVDRKSSRDGGESGKIPD